jgi:hypothetical protein
MGCTIQPKFLTPDWKTAYNLGGLSKGSTISPCWDFGFLGWEGGFLRCAEQAAVFLLVALGAVVPYGAYRGDNSSGGCL